MRTKRILISFVLCLVLSACGGPTPAATETIDSPEDIASAPTETVVVPTNTPEVVREAVFSEVNGQVDFRQTADVEFVPANLEDMLLVGGQAQTGPDGKTKLDLLPDGTIIRLSKQSLFTLTELNPDADDPYTKITLLVGELWIILNGGSLEVDTPSGIASVRGSMMGLGVNPDTGNAVVTCLEGHCAIENQFGVTSLEGGQAAEAADDTAPSEPRLISLRELDRWREEVPEAKEVLFEIIGHNPVDDGVIPQENTFGGAVGFWESTDSDGSHQNLSIQLEDSGVYSVYYLDHGASICGTEGNTPQYAGDYEGSGSAVGNTLSVTSDFICHKNGGEAVLTLTITYTYDAASDTVNDGFVTWHRAD